VRILIVNYFHPPMVDAQAFRWAQLARHWAAQGHAVTVVTGRVHGAPRAERAHGVEILRTGLRSRPTMLASAAAPSSPRAAWTGRLREGLRRLYRKIYWPDAWWHWLPGAAWHVARLARRQDLIVSYSPSFAAHVSVLLARALRLAGKARWVADYGDPYSTSHSMPPNNFAWFGRVNRRVERAVIDGADAVVFNSPQTRTDYDAAFAAAANFHVVPHLADLDALYAGLRGGGPAADEAAVRLTYIGGFHRGIREPYELIAWLRALAERSPVPLALDLYGPDNGFDLAGLAGGPVRYHGMVARERALALAAGADLLVNVDNRDCTMTPSKIVEYIGSGRPVLHLTAGSSHPSLDRAAAAGYARVVNAAGDAASRDADLEWVLRHAGQVASRDAVRAMLQGFLLPDIAAEYLRRAGLEGDGG
jgi:hypothetical protein